MSFLGMLREETMECHVGLEKSLDIVRRVTTDDDYRVLLTRFYTLYEPLEAGMAQAIDWEAAGWKFSDHVKAPWLREDLLALGVAATQIAEWPRYDKMTMPDNFGEAIGCLYVVEGSTLGGQVLAKQFRETLGVTPERGGRFFQGYGAATMSSWRTFGSWADSRATVTNLLLKEQAVRGARNTFGAFSQWLT
jgi:heme oxygenase